MSANNETSETPQFLEKLRQRSSSLKQEQRRLISKRDLLLGSFQSLSAQREIIIRQKELQSRKSKTLILLVAQLQRQYDQTYIESRGVTVPNDVPEAKQQESKTIRKLLVKVSQRNKGDQNILSYLREASRLQGNPREFFKKKSLIEDQCQLLEQLRFEIHGHENGNYQCRRKWKQLRTASLRARNQASLAQIQLERLKAQMKTQYQAYLQSMRKSKMKILSFNERQEQKIITSHFIEEMASLQQTRLAVEEQARDLARHQDDLGKQLNQLVSQNHSLKEFFLEQSANKQSSLANKMKKRIEELNDVLFEEHQRTRLAWPTFSLNLDYLKAKLIAAKEANQFINIKLKAEKNGKLVLNEPEIILFFQNVIKSKDEMILTQKDRLISAKRSIGEFTLKRELLENQLNNLRQALQYHSYEESLNSNNNRLNYKIGILEQALPRNPKPQGTVFT